MPLRMSGPTSQLEGMCQDSTQHTSIKSGVIKAVLGLELGTESKLLPYHHTKGATCHYKITFYVTFFFQIPNKSDGVACQYIVEWMSHILKINKSYKKIYGLIFCKRLGTCTYIVTWSAIRSTLLDT